MKTFAWLSFLLINTAIFAQENYDLLYLQKEYQQIIEKSAKLITPEDYYWNSVMLDKTGKTLEAIDVLNKGVSLFENNVNIEKLLADFLYKTGQYTLAKPILIRYMYNSEDFIKYIKILEFQEEYKTAIDLLKSAIDDDTANLDYLQHLGKNYHQIDSIDRAIEVFKEVLTINPKDQSNALRLASLLIKDKQYAKAIEICDIGLLNDATNKKLIRTKGIASFTIKEFEISETCFQYLFDEGDTTTFVLKRLGISFFQNNLYSYAQRHLMQAFQNNPKDLEICYFLGKCYLYTHEPEEGLYYFDLVESLLQPDPKTLASLYMDKENIYSRLGNFKEALYCYQKAYEYNPKPEYIFHIAMLYQNRLNDPKSALKNYERFLNLLPDNAEVDSIDWPKDEITVALKSRAEDNISNIKKDLFFDGKMN